jgi:hypothetical protein
MIRFTKLNQSDESWRFEAPPIPVKLEASSKIRY